MIVDDNLAKVEEKLDYIAHESRSGRVCGTSQQLAVVFGSLVP
ncbi:hypothetical protein [Schlesneria sp. T3-172]